MRVDSYRSIEAPEGVELGLRVAGPFPRALAWLVDVSTRVMIYLFVFSFVGALLEAALGDVGLGLMLIAAFVVHWFWDVAWEMWRGGNLGKLILGLRVVCDDGSPIGWSQSCLRNFLRFADMLPFGYAFGFLSCLTSADFKRLGDRVAGTVVVHGDRSFAVPQLPEAETLLPRVPLTAEERTAVVEFAARSARWTPGRRIEVADQASALTEATGEEGVRRLLGMARWIQGESG